jgi:large subunit ribosomal protein L21
MYAVVRHGSSQIKMSEGDILDVTFIDGVKEGDLFTFSDVMLVADGDKISIGAPTIAGMSVEAEVISQKKGKKIRVAKFKAKARYRRVSGFRPLLTQIKIKSIGKLASEKLETKEVKSKTTKKAPVKSKTV